MQYLPARTHTALEALETSQLVPQFNVGSYKTHTGCHRRNGPNFGRVFLMLNYTDITQNTYIQS